MLNRNVIIALVAVLSLLSTYAVHRYVVRVESQKIVAIEKAKTEKAIKETETKIRDEELAIRKKKDAEIKRLNNSLAIAINSLRNRPSRESGSESAQTSTSCTGAQLYREDAEFLTREAHRAESVRIDRDYYYEQYENARQKLGEK